MLSVTYAECHIKASYTECRFAECRCTEGRGTTESGLNDQLTHL
jgi:hypothetical protein